MKGDFSRQTFRPERHYSAVVQQQGRVTLDADFNEQAEIERHRLRTLVRDVIGPCGGPRGAAGFEIRLDRSGRQLLIGAGRYYVDGLLAENEAECAFEHQPDLPTATAIFEHAMSKPARMVVYLDVWERIVTPLQDPSLLEPALGGPDTSLRLKVIWQVRLALLKQARQLSCGEHGRDDGRASLDVRTGPGGYSGLENRLYRLEVHSVDESGSAKFKWSRDNASLAFRVDRIDGNLLTVASGGVDALARLAAGYWLELTDDAIELEGNAGQLIEVATVEPAARTITLTSAAAPLTDGEAGVDPLLYPKARPWDGVGELPPIDGTANWLPLEDGIEVKFGGGELHPGDYWLIPARTSEGRGGSLDWPTPEPQGAGLVGQPARRIEHRCCPLAVVELGPRPKRWRVVENRRRIFAPVA